MTVNMTSERSRVCPAHLSQEVMGGSQCTQPFVQDSTRHLHVVSCNVFEAMAATASFIDPSLSQNSGDIRFPGYLLAHKELKYINDPVVAD